MPEAATLEIVGTGLSTLKLVGTELPPPGAGFVTVTGKVPPLTMSAGVMAAVTWLELIKVVVLAAPLKFTTDRPTKFVPFTVSVKPAPSTGTLLGERVVIVGTGLLLVKEKMAAEATPATVAVTV